MKYLLTGLFLITTLISYGQDAKGSKDHYLIGRYPGSEIKFYYSKAYNELKLPIAINNGEVTKALDAKGKHTSILYAGPEGRSTLEIYRNYEQRIKDEGGEILFSCSGKNGKDGCDNYNEYYSLKFFRNVYQSRRNNTDQYTYVEGGSDDQAFIVAKIEKEDRTLYIEIGVAGQFLGHPSSIQLEVIEEKKMEDGMLTVDKIKQALDTKGKVSLYGIYFDTGSANIKPSSHKELNLVIEYLQKNPAVKLYVVGHTDDTGDLESNKKLSKERAKAVKTYLTNKGIGADRLLSGGAGPLAPVASNENEDGKKLNRRVELVKRLK